MRRLSPVEWGPLIMEPTRDRNGATEERVGEIIWEEGKKIGKKTRKEWKLEMKLEKKGNLKGNQKGQENGKEIEKESKLNIGQEGQYIKVKGEENDGGNSGM